jgi:DNA-binding transcriptional MerR regulator
MGINSNHQTSCPHCGEEFEDMVLISMPKEAYDLPNAVHQKEIDQFGLGPEVIKLKGQGLTNEEIGIKLGFTTSQIQHYVQSYRAMPVEQKKQLHSRSVFHVADELQSHYSELLLLLKEATRDENPDLKLNTLRELRNYMKLSADLVEKLQKMKDDEAYKNAVLDILDKMSPGSKATALKQIANFKQGIAIIKPI